MPTLPVVAFAFTVLLSLASVFGSFILTKATAEGSAKEIVVLKDEGVDRDKVIFGKLKVVEDMTIRHDTMIPAIDKRLDKMDDKLDRILMEVRK